MTMTEESTTRKRRFRGGFSPLTLKRQASGENSVAMQLPPPSMKQLPPPSLTQVLTPSLRISVTSPYNHHSNTSIAHFHRDEIITGASLPLTDTPHFQFYDVCGIQTHEDADITDVMTEASTSSDHDQAHHHRQFPEAPHIAAEEEERARAVMQAQTRSATGKVSGTNKPLHKYMIKQLHSKCPSPEHAMAHLKHETQLWKKLSHQHYNLLTVRGTAGLGMDTVFGSQWDSHFLLTDRIAETLAQRLQRWRKESTNPKKWWFQAPKPKNIPQAQVDTTSRDFRLKLVYAQNLASVLAYLHSKHIVVRNLSPESIGFLASDDTLQLMDLGQALEVRSDLATEQHPSISSETMLLQQNEHPLFDMTPGGQPFRYMAPELLTTDQGDEEKQQSCGTAVDSYSWAMIAFCLLTLHLPFGKMKAGQHLKQVALRSPSLRPHLAVYELPKKIERLLKQAWRQEPSQRMEAAQIDKRLQQFLEEELHDGTSRGQNSNVYEADV